MSSELIAAQDEYRLAVTPEQYEQAGARLAAAELNLRAELAMRVEDLRIARKHRIEASARNYSPTNARAYAAALAWEEVCSAREQAARAAVITSSSTTVLS